MEIELSERPKPPMRAALASIPEDTLIFIQSQFECVVQMDVPAGRGAVVGVVDRGVLSWMNTKIAKGARGGSTRSTAAANDFPRKLPAKVDLIFRSSEKLAEKTVNMFEIWRGELVFKDVAVGGSDE